MQTSDYWTRLSRGRASRRRLMASTGAAGLSAALLAACGGDGEPDEAGSGLVTKRADTSNQAKRGGAYRANLNFDFNTTDPHRNNAQYHPINQATVSGLFSVKPGHLEASSGDVSGDLAESWEFSPDGLQLTVNLRPNVKWHPLPPVNGRAFDADDVNFTWKRWSELGQNRSQVLNSVNPTAPILSMTMTGQRTMVFKMKFPVVGTLALLVPNIPGWLCFMPKEAEGGYELRSTIIGTGPFYVTNYQPSVGLTLKRHPDHWDQERPYVDEIQLPFISEYATATAQFRTGNLFAPNSSGFAIRAEDVLPTKREVPQLVMSDQATLGNKGSHAYFGWRPASAFRDERVRQAYSMSWDRDTYIDVVFDVTKFRSEGLPMETRWNSASNCNDLAGWWLDPKSKDFGPDAKYFEHNIAEAKKLLAAAGHANGVEQISTWPTDGYGGIGRDVEILEGMSAEAGFRFKTQAIPFVTDFVPRYRDAHGDFEGVAYRGTGANQPDAVERYLTEYSQALQVFFVINDGKPDPQLEAMLATARGEFNKDKRIALMEDVQRYLAKVQYAVKFPGGATQFELLWPAVRNRGVFVGDSRNSDYYYSWLDQTKAPFTS